MELSTECFDCEEFLDIRENSRSDRVFLDVLSFPLSFSCRLSILNKISSNRSRVAVLILISKGASGTYSVILSHIYRYKIS